MRQYQVPQFIDIEDKIVGPLTLKQFIYLAGGGALTVVAFYLFDFVFFLFFAAPVAAFSLALAFLKINGIPFPKIIGSMVNYMSKPHLYLWKQLPPEKKSEPAKAEESEKKALSVPKLTESKLQDLAWSLDIKEKTNQPDEL